MVSTISKETPTFRTLKLCLVQGKNPQELRVASRIFNEVIGIVLKFPTGDKISVLLTSLNFFELAMASPAKICLASEHFSYR